QLLLYLFFFLLTGIALAAVRWRAIPTTDKELSTWSREFWIFIGVLVLCLMGVFVIAYTSIPVWNRIVEFFGGSSNAAPPADQVWFYTRYQRWFAIVVALLSAVGQFVWWKKMDARRLGKELLTPLLITLMVFVLFLQLIVSRHDPAVITKPAFLAILLAGIFTVVANGRILISLLRKSPGLSGGAVAHIGVGLMLVGILFSAGYSKIVSLNNTGLLYNKEASDEFNRDNLLLFINEPAHMAEYAIQYLGERL